MRRQDVIKNALELGDIDLILVQKDIARELGRRSIEQPPTQKCKRDGCGRVDIDYAGVCPAHR